jgi:hypothetical protein
MNIPKKRKEDFIIWVINRQIPGLAVEQIFACDGSAWNVA